MSAMLDLPTSSSPGGAAAIEVELGGERLLLLAQKAALLVDRQTLLVADVHLGKAHSFRRLGVPVPHGTSAETLGRLSALLQRHAVRRIVFLGDLLHSRHAQAPSTRSALADWCAAHGDVQRTLVRGNHDRHAGDPAAAFGFEVVDEPLILGGLALCHHPASHPGRYVLAGHLHPCVGIGGAARDRLRLPCFHLGAGCGVLPAFGAFTGMHPVEPAPSDRLLAIADDHLFELRCAARGAAAA